MIGAHSPLPRAQRFCSCRAPFYGAGGSSMTVTVVAASSSCSSGSQSVVVSHVEPVVSKAADDKHKDLVAYHPTISVIHEGAALQVTPISNSSGKFVVLDVHSRVSSLQRRAGGDPEAAAPKTAGDHPSPRDVVDAIDRPVLVTQRLSTTL